MAEGDASEGLLSRLGLRRGLASKVPNSAKSASKNLELASEAAQTARFFEATQISAT